MMQETLCRRRCLLKILKNYAGFKPERNVFAEHRYHALLKSATPKIQTAPSSVSNVHRRSRDDAAHAAQKIRRAQSSAWSARSRLIPFRRYRETLKSSVRISAVADGGARGIMSHHLKKSVSSYLLPNSYSLGQTRDFIFAHQCGHFFLNHLSNGFTDQLLRGTGSGCVRSRLAQRERGRPHSRATCCIEEEFDGCNGVVVLWV
jgi:hypothetical protein